MAPKTRRLEKQDRISDLPDGLIHHILSFFPSFKQAIPTGTLSKRWHKQWTHTPALIFDSTGMSRDKFLDFIEKALLLHDCSKIRTFHLNYSRLGHGGGYTNDPRFDEKIRYAMTRQVEDLCLQCTGFRDECFLPEFLFDATSLVKLRTESCSLFPTKRVNWVFLKALILAECRFSSEALGYILSGSPLLESCQLDHCSAVGEDEHKFHKLVITSKSLKNLVLKCFGICILEISCPNLEELSIKRLWREPKLFDEAIENAMSKCLLLESFELRELCWLRHPVIASESLKKLVMSHLCSSKGLEIVCPKLEDFKLLGYNKIKNLRFRDVPSSLCATLDICNHREIHKSFTEGKNTLQQLQHIKKLTVGQFIHEMLEDCVVGGSSFPLLHIKCLILDNPFWPETLSGIPCLLQNLPVLEILFLKFYSHSPYNDDVAKLDTFGEDCWSSNANGFNCLVSHLKTVKIGCSLWGNSNPSPMLNFVQFLLNNARVLENLTVVLTLPYPKQLPSIVSQELFGFTRCSEHAIVELISKSFGNI